MLPSIRFRSTRRDKRQASFLSTLALRLREDHRKLPFVQIVQKVKQSMTTGFQVSVHNIQFNPKI